ncbi:hypothetical protein V5H98_11820 [Georgenia sp. M64]|uniref:hypothetical protein n=1 Tax=Georgenia sp. M64 TaxID=3120520 RepID=UPI0030E2355E
MTRLGVTGHQSIPAQAIGYVTAGMQAVIAEQRPPLVGYSSLAAGTDQLFARELLAAGGDLHAVIPSGGYEATFSGQDHDNYANLLSAATTTTVLEYPGPSEEAYDAAGKWIAEHCHILIAVWDGEPARGRGGTADAVAYARELGRNVRIIWPTGLSRD